MSACIAGIAALLLVIGVLFMFGKTERPTQPPPPAISSGTCPSAITMNGREAEIPQCTERFGIRFESNWLCRPELSSRASTETSDSTDYLHRERTVDAERAETNL
jgi:hypothetical protein